MNQVGKTNVTMWKNRDAVRPKKTSTPSKKKWKNQKSRTTS